MLMTFIERATRCEQLFWTTSKWIVVVRCQECSRLGEACVPSVMSLDGKVKLSCCESCRKDTCLPVLKDCKTLAEVGK